VATDTVQGFGHAAYHKDGGGRNNHNLTDFRLKTEFHKEASIQMTSPTQPTCSHRNPELFFLYLVTFFITDTEIVQRITN